MGVWMKKSHENDIPHDSFVTCIQCRIWKVGIGESIRLMWKGF